MLKSLEKIASTSIQITDIDRTREQSPKTSSDDLSHVLTEFNLEYTSIDYCWQVGVLQKTQGWILHISIVRSQLIAALKEIIPYLKKENVPFKIVRDIGIARRILNGDFGPKLLAKVVTIYPPTDQKAVGIASTLIALTKSFKGPSILTDFCLENVVYTRYGAFSPIWVTASDGRPTKHIYDQTGVLVEDSCPIPFSLPAGVAWPFHTIAMPQNTKPIKLVNARYYPISTIRDDFKGAITKAIYFRRLWSIKACVIKQGYKNMNADDTGRDISDRLRWQYDLCKELKGTIPVPKIFDYFIENGDTYLAMEYVKGKTIWDWLDDIYGSCSWFDISSSKKISVLKILLQIIDIADRLHKRGFIHRDITPANFIITKANKVIPIDLELVWSFTEQKTSTPFQLGTPGFMSTQQERAETPTINDDIYAIGALILTACTNLNPSKFSKQQGLQLHSILEFLTQNQRLSTSISNCLEISPIQRPDLNTIKDTITSCIAFYERPQSPSNTSVSERVATHQLGDVLQSAINGLAHPSLLDHDCQWLSNSTSDLNLPVEQQEPRASFIGWHTGVAGPLWLLSLAKSNGFEIEACKDIFERNLNFIYTHFFDADSLRDPSLFHGGAGIALALNEGINSGFLSKESEIINKIEQCFSITTEELVLSRGIAGQGLALLHVSDKLDPSFSKPLLFNYISKLVNSQQPDGSWNIYQTILRKRTPSIRLNEGNAGIIWFLLSYLQNHPDNSLEQTTRNGLAWLIKNKAAKAKWKRIQSGNISKDWFSGQTSGDLTILMIKAYEVFGDKQYRLLAETCLKPLPKHPVHSNFSLNNGLARLGEIYLEAARVLQKDQYRENASWITNLFMHSFVPGKKNDGHWNIINNYPVTADLFVGSAGIIHYLLKYLRPAEIAYPLY